LTEGGGEEDVKRTHGEKEHREGNSWVELVVQCSRQKMGGGKVSGGRGGKGGELGAGRNG